MITQGALATSASVYARLLGTTPDTTTLVLVPLFHNTGFLDQLAQMLVGGGGVDLLPEFHVGDAIDALVRRPASYLIAVPSIFRLMMLDPARRRRVRAVPDPRLRRRADAARPGSPSWHARWPSLRPFNSTG